MMDNDIDFGCDLWMAPCCPGSFSQLFERAPGHPGHAHVSREYEFEFESGWKTSHTNVSRERMHK